MLSQLEAIEEYNNVGALYGLDGLEGADAELMGMLGRIKSPVRRQRFINKMTMPGIASKGSRAEMEKHFAELPAHIQEGLRKGELRLADVIMYSIKPINGSKTIKMFETQDDKEIGLRNVSNAKLQKNQALLVSGIFILAGTTTDGTKDKMMSTQFDKIEDFGAICSGEFNLKSNKKVIVPEMSNAAFKTYNMNTVPLGYFKLANPRLIIDDVLIEATIELGTIVGLPDFTNLFIGLQGTITTP